MHYYKFNVASWAKDTSHLSLKEEGIYLRLINYYYDTEKPIPVKTHLVLRKLRVADESEAVELILEEFFTKTKDGWIHNHCDKLIGEYQKMAERNKKNAKLGGRPKNKDLEKPTGIPDANQEETKSNPTGIPNQELLTNNQEPVTKEIRAKRFTPPTHIEALDYFKERGLASEHEAQRFIDFYEMKGWMVGKNKMKDWKAAIRNWMKNCSAPSKPQGVNAIGTDFSAPEGWN